MNIQNHINWHQLANTKETGSSVVQTQKKQEVPRQVVLFTEETFHEAHEDITKAPQKEPRGEHCL